jgi:activating signal cointegrator complex subunit 3
MLPQIEVNMNIVGDIPDVSKQQQDSSQKKMPKLRIEINNEKKVYNLYEDEEYVINLDLVRISRSKNRYNGKAYAPKYSKPKDENWIIVLGENVGLAEAKNQLVGLKRVNSLKTRQNTNVIFKTPLIKENLSQNELSLTLYLMSDNYLGLDQQYEMKFKLIKRVE